PRVVGALAERRAVWGVAPAAIRRARDPFRVASILKEASFPHPRVAQEAPADGRWLVKARRGAGGGGGHFWWPRAAVPRRGFLQEFIEGESYAAVFCSGATGATFLGLTRQLVGEGWARSNGFHYCGSIGPIALEEAQANELRRLGALLVPSLGLRGLFGVDL